MALYNVDDYERNQWRYQRMMDQRHQHVVNNGEKRYERFSNFSEEVFHRFINPAPSPVETPEPGQDIFQRLHSAIGELPEVEDLRSRCVNDEEYSAVAANCVMQGLLDKVDAPAEQVKSASSDLEDIKAMEQMMERIKGGASRKLMNDEIEKRTDDAAEKTAMAEHLASEMDSTDIREALRQAAKEANSQIDELVSNADALPGDEQHSGKRQRRAASAAVAKVLKGNDRMKEIMRLAGRLKRVAMAEQSKKVRAGSDEYCGIETGANFEKLVPSEWMYLDDPDLDMNFFQRANECALAQFEVTTKEKDQQGPVIVLLDSSGSMSYYGVDAWAAAVAMAFMQIAISQKRSFALVHFGSHVLRTDMFNFSEGEAVDNEKTINAISYFASDGGTNFMGPLNAAIDIVSCCPEHKNSDIIMITDGHATISDEWLNNYQQHKEAAGFSTYSILVGPDTSKGYNELFSDKVVHLDDLTKGDKDMHEFFSAV